jgi:hypothetical protein
VLAGLFVSRSIPTIATMLQGALLRLLAQGEHVSCRDADDLVGLEGAGGRGADDEGGQECRDSEIKVLCRPGSPVSG